MRSGPDHPFPILEGRANAMPYGDDFYDSITLQDVDQLMAETRILLEFLSIPESEINLFPQQQLYEYLEEKWELAGAVLIKLASGRGGRVLQLILQCWSNRSMLNRLCKLCDASIRTGQIRCIAIQMLSVILKFNDDVWKVQVSNGVSFASQAISVYSKALFDNSLRDDDVNMHGDVCCCSTLCHVSLYKAIIMSKAGSNDIIKRTSEWDWRSILNSHRSNIPCFDSPLCVGLDLVCRLQLEATFVLKRNPRDINARSLLRQTGSAPEFLRRTLQNVVQGKFWGGRSKEVDSKRLIEAVSQLQLFFSFRMGPLQSDSEIDDLARSAKNYILSSSISLLGYSCKDIARRRPTNGDCNKQRLQDIMEIMSSPNWNKMKNETEAESWKRIKQLPLFSEKDDAKSQVKRETKEYRHDIKRTEQEFAEKKTGKCALSCAYCFVSEQKKTLFVCARCKSISYCSVECQTRHWRKSHKKHCTKL